VKGREFKFAPPTTIEEATGGNGGGSAKKEARLHEIGRDAPSQDGEERPFSFLGEEPALEKEEPRWKYPRQF